MAVIISNRLYQSQFQSGSLTYQLATYQFVAPQFSQVAVGGGYVEATIERLISPEIGAAAMINWTNVTVTLDALKPWERNPKRIGKKQAQRLLEYWDKIGQFQTVAIGPNGEVYDGHQRLNVLKAAHGGKFEIDARQADRELTEVERQELVIQAHAGTTGTWDWDALSGWDTEALQSWGLDGDTLRQWQEDAGALGLMLETMPDFEPVDADEQPRLDRKEPVYCPHCGKNIHDEPEA